MQNKDTKTKLQALIRLSHSIKIYVPSTVNVNQQADNSLIVEETLRFLSKLFGGATSYLARGCWLSKDSELILERVIICESFTTSEKLDKHFDEIFDFLQDQKKILSQESIAFELNNELYLI